MDGLDRGGSGGTGNVMRRYNTAVAPLVRSAATIERADEGGGRRRNGIRFDLPFLSRVTNDRHPIRAAGLAEG